jgi:hypothetical protein
MVSLAVATAVTLADPEQFDDLTPAASFVTDLDAVDLALAAVA